MLTMTNPIVISNSPSSPSPVPTSSHNAGLAIFHCFPLSFPTSLSPSISSLFLPPAAPLSLGRLFFRVPHLSTWALVSPCSPQRRVCVHAHCGPKGGGGGAPAPPPPHPRRATPPPPPPQGGGGGGWGWGAGGGGGGDHCVRPSLKAEGLPAHRHWLKPSSLLWPH